MRQLAAHEAMDLKNPNKAYGLFCTFGRARCGLTAPTTAIGFD